MQRITDYGLSGMVKTSPGTATSTRDRARPIPSPGARGGAGPLERRATAMRERTSGLGVRVFVAASRDAVGPDAAPGIYVHPDGVINVGTRACKIAVRTRPAGESDRADGPAPGRRSPDELDPDQRRQVVEAVAPLGPMFARAARATRTFADVRALHEALGRIVERQRRAEGREAGRSAARDTTLSYELRNYLRECASAGKVLG